MPKKKQCTKKRLGKQRDMAVHSNRSLPPEVPRQLRSNKDIKDPKKALQCALQYTPEKLQQTLSCAHEAIKMCALPLDVAWTDISLEYRASAEKYVIGLQPLLSAHWKGLRSLSCFSPDLLVSSLTRKSSLVQAVLYTAWSEAKEHEPSVALAKKTQVSISSTIQHKPVFQSNSNDRCNTMERLQPLASSSSALAAVTAMNQLALKMSVYGRTHDPQAIAQKRFATRSSRSLRALSKPRQLLICTLAIDQKTRLLYWQVEQTSPARFNHPSGQVGWTEICIQLRLSKHRSKLYWFHEEQPLHISSIEAFRQALYAMETGSSHKQIAMFIAKDSATLKCLGTVFGLDPQALIPLHSVASQSTWKGTVAALRTEI